MRHLRVLESAHLLFARRDGKRRWNHLNPVPIQHVYERWVKPYEPLWASHGLRLKQFVESKKGINVMSEQLRAVDIELEIPISATKHEVWKALISDIGLWWPKEAFMTKANKVCLEARVGGRVFEDKGDGTGGVWWYIHAIETGEYLVLTGQIWPGFGGPATSIAKLSLEESGKETILKIHDCLFGRLTDDRIASVKWGWDHLFAKSLKPYAEAKSSE